MEFRSQSYQLQLIRGYLASVSGLILIAYFMSQVGNVRFAETVPFVSDNPAFYHMLIVAPSEELVFRFFVPLLLMVVIGVDYLVGGIVAGILFGLAHWWAYGQSSIQLTTAILAGIWQAIVVYFFSTKQDESFSFKPGLLAAILGHGTYNVLVTVVPEYALVVGIVSGLGFLGTLLVRQ